MLEEIKALIDKQGVAFEEFKATHAEELKAHDAATEAKLAKIETDMDKALEEKARLETEIAAERKEREDLEARMNRASLEQGRDVSAADVRRQDFEKVLQRSASARGRHFEGLSVDDYDAYRKAQDTFLRNGEKGMDAAEVKVMSAGSDPDGGYFVTPDISGRIVTKIFETSPMRQIASIQAITTDSLEGVEDTDEAGAGYAGETAQGSDVSTPQIGKWTIPTYWLDTEPKATQQLLDDAAVNVEAWLGAKVADKLGRFENAEFVAGATGRIRGLTSYDTVADTGSGVAWGSIGYVASGAAGAFATSNPLDKLHDLVGAVKQFYLGGSRWLTNRGTITAIRKIKDGNGNYIWQPSLVAGAVETIMGFGVTRAEDMPALAADSYSLAFGDFMAGYQIVDRNGIRVLRDPYTAKPYVKFYTTKRTGGGVTNFEAFKLMKFAAS